MLNLQRVTMFIAVVDAGSFTLPQRRWGRPRQWSALTSAAENELGVDPGLAASTRAFGGSLTPGCCSISAGWRS